jgi:calcium-dependent protein kinase
VLKQALMQYIVSQMTTEKEVEELQKTFQGLDTNKDGHYQIYYNQAS